MITIPSLLFIYPQLPPQTAMGTALALTLLSSIRNSWSFYRQGKRWRWDIIAPIVIFMLLSSLPAGQLALILPPHWAKRLLGSYLLLASGQIFFLRDRNSSLRNNDHLGSNQALTGPGHRIVLWQGIGSGILVGTTSVLTGIGGGVILIPILLKVFKMPQQQVPLYTNGLMIFSCIFALLTYLSAAPPAINPLPASLLFAQVGQVNWPLAGLLFLVGSATYHLGIWLNRITPPARMNKIFVALMLTLGMKLLLG